MEFGEQILWLFGGLFWGVAIGAYICRDERNEAQSAARKAEAERRSEEAQKEIALQTLKRVISENQKYKQRLDILGYIDNNKV